MSQLSKHCKQNSNSYKNFVTCQLKNYNQMNKSLCLLCFCLASIFYTCTSREDCCTVIDTNFAIEYISENGKSLFDSTRTYLPENIKLYFKNGTKYELAYSRNLDNPNYFTLDTTAEGVIHIGILPSNFYEGNFSTTLIELKPDVIDTIKCEFDLSHGNELFKNAWYNGVKKEGRLFKIIK